MPYEGELAGHLAHVSTAKSQLVRDVLATYEVTGDDDGFARALLDDCVPLSDLDATVKPQAITRCLAIDGSRQQDVVARTGGRPVSVGYVRVGGCFIDLAAWRDLNSQTFVDPAAVSATRRGVALDYVLPGSGVAMRGAKPGESWRQALDAFFAAAIITDEVLYDPQGINISLADALLLLHGTDGQPADQAPVRACPVCGERGEPIAWVTREGGHCGECKSVLYLADSLGLDTAMSSESSRENALTVTMNVAERLSLVAFIELLRTRGLAELASTLIVADGPLAAFGPLAPISHPLRRYLEAVGDEVLDAGHGPLLVVGVEKSGEFVSHGETIVDLIPPGHAMRLTNAYIAHHVTGQGMKAKPYGQQHLYGRRFFYRRNDGHLLTVTVPSASGIVPWSLDPASEDWTSYPTLRPILELLESLRSTQHKGAVLPLVFAHGISALPMGTGQSVLTLIGQEGLGLTQNSRVKGEVRKGPW